MRMIADRLPGDNPLRRVPYKRCDDAALSALEPELFAAAKAAVYDTRWMDNGEMREVTERDDNGMAIRTWVGKESFVKNPLYGHRDCRKVVRLSAPAGSVLWQSAAETRRNGSGGW